ncbi:ANTAR domain-containing protein [Hoeflea sp. E7-10]|uniref:ANTAR domain-containing protein n=2 Tax=Hoeflea poritis TaxID=2993659 RepID=A0ABT4VVG7_9HYPH|nr:ANTAR domain-containing protein [Hoeflea poritis]
MLAAHLGRIGCLAISGWPIPEKLPTDVDVIITTVDPEHREAVQGLIEQIEDLGPPIIALAEYEDPSTLQLVLELRAVSVIERPVKPFGLLTNLMIARDVWRRRWESVERVKDAENRHFALSKVAVAKIVIAEQQGLSDVDAHKSLQKMAMDTRSSLESSAERVIAEGAPPGLISALKKLAT